MSFTLSFEIWLESDYHISAGHGLGARIDAALLRDADGVPVIRGTTITGLLRDGLRRLLQLQPLQHYRQCKASGLTGQHDPTYCGVQGPSQGQCPLCMLFGTPLHPKRWRIASARPVDLQGPARRGWKLGGTGGQAIQRVKVNPATRRAEARKLFSQEVGDARLAFCFTAECEAEDQQVQDEAALMVAAARYTRGLGRSRRRGYGTCSITLTNVTTTMPLHPSPPGQHDPQAYWLQHFENRWLRSAKVQEHSQVLSQGDEATIRQASEQTSQQLPNLGQENFEANQDVVEPIRVRVVLRTDEPVLIAERAEAGKQFESLDVITGQTLLGTLARLAADRHGIHGQQWRDNDAYNDFVDVFFRDAISFPMLYRAFDSGGQLRPSIPAPRNLLTCKTFPALEGMRHEHPRRNLSLTSRPTATRSTFGSAYLSINASQQPSSASQSP